MTPAKALDPFEVLEQSAEKLGRDPERSDLLMLPQEVLTMILAHLFHGSKIVVTVPDCTEKRPVSPERQSQPPMELKLLSHLNGGSWFLNNPEAPKRIKCSGASLAILHTCRCLFFTSIQVLYTEATFTLPIDQPLELFYKAWPEFASRIQYVSLDSTTRRGAYSASFPSSDFESFVCPGILWAFPNLRRFEIYDQGIQERWEYSTRETLELLRKNLEQVGKRNCLVVVVVQRLEHVYRPDEYPHVWVVRKETIYELPLFQGDSYHVISRKILSQEPSMLSLPPVRFETRRFRIPRFLSPIMDTLRIFRWRSYSEGFVASQMDDT